MRGTFDDTSSKLSPKAEFAKARRAETTFGRQLRQVARHVSDIVKGFDVGDPLGRLALQTALFDYAKLIEPWAKAATARMIAEVNARDKSAWANVSTAIGVDLRQQLDAAPIGAAVQEMLNEAVPLITSLPAEAAQRVHDLTLKGLTQGQRYSDIVGEIMRTGEVTRSRANLIARTETARTASLLTQTRAMAVGADSYTWTTAHDADVRQDHKILDGRVFKWSSPPIADQRTGTRAHPGQIWNCRCVAIPVIAE